jgi:hypothetical protein
MDGRLKPKSVGEALTFGSNRTTNGRIRKASRMSR